MEEIITQHTLKDINLNDTLNKEGYVVVPFLSPEEVKDLTAYFYNYHQHKIPGFYASTHSPDVAFRLQMNDKIKSVYQNHVDRLFHQCEALGGSFIVKTKEQADRLPPHQDWNIVDESLFRSFNIWVPLVNLSDENGAIRVLPKSHLWGTSYRGPNIPDPRQDKLDEIWNKMTTLRMKAGEALIYDHSLYHASFPNQTDEFRLATVFGVKPKDANMFYYFGTQNGIDMYESNVAFFLTGDIQNGPATLKKVRTVVHYKKASHEGVTSSGRRFWGKLKALLHIK